LTPRMYENLLSCTRCGACLPVCPTYNATWLEAQSPRGRVALITAAQDGHLQLSPNLAAQMYHCLDCRACQTACPSGVRIGELVLEQRALLPSAGPGAWLKRLILRGVLGSHRTVALASMPLALYQNLGIRAIARRLGLLRLLPRRVQELEASLPRVPWRPLMSRLPAVSTAAPGRARGTAPPTRVGFFLGCAMSALFADVSSATVRVLTGLGCEVVTPKAQRCCGAPHLDQGDRQAALNLARANIRAFEAANVQLVVADCAACSASLKEYAELLADDPAYASRANAFSARVMDINQFLASRIPSREHLKELRRRVTYHSPCHLAHAQGICNHPRAVLRSLPGIELVELPEAEWCCGSAGAYMLTHPTRSSDLMDRKMANVASTGADAVVTSNPGCMLQLRMGCHRHGLNMEVRHVVELVDEALCKDGCER
jgi:glycolate oxidase iron-sulfur subunit